MRRFAENTSVSVGRSRGELDDLLRRWGCHGICWADDYRAGRVVLEFTWEHDGVEYLARFSLEMPTDEMLREDARDGRSRKFSESKYRKLIEGRGRQEHRILLLWIKAALNAVDAGIVNAATLFLPFLVGRTGETFAEVALPRLPKLLRGSATRLLPAPTESEEGER